MPNIIEQQDLLKGLPDDRLAAMMQAPTGDIPPFLVAAEAQRRQTIREQFSGGPQESVVDTLTKQMANVPQNIQAPAQQPPQMPPPDMGGVAALQGGQQMRDGGYVQRYQAAGLVVPSSVEDLAVGITGISPEEYAQRERLKEIQELGPGRARYLLENPTMPTTEAELARRELKAATEGPFKEFYSPESVYEAAKAVTKTSPQKSDPYRYGMTAEERQMMQARPPVADVPTPPTDPGKEPTSDENKLKEYEAQLRAIGQIGSGDSAYIKGKLQELYGDNEASDWEKAQKWFAAAQAAIEPGQNNWQAAVNALSAFGGGMAEERAAERAGDRELAEALLKYEIADRQYRTETERDIAKDMMNYRISLEEAERDADAARRAAEKDALKYGTDINIRQAEMFGRSAQKSEDDLVRLVNSLRQNGITDEEIAKNAEVVSLQQRIKELYDRQNDALATSSLGTRRYGEAAGVDLSFEEADGINPIRRVQ